MLASAFLRGDRPATSRLQRRAISGSFAPPPGDGTRASPHPRADRRRRRPAAAAAPDRPPGPRNAAPCRLPRASPVTRRRARPSSATHFSAASVTSPGPQLTSLSDRATSRPSRIMWTKWASGSAPGSAWISTYRAATCRPIAACPRGRVGLEEGANRITGSQRIVPLHQRSHLLPRGRRSHPNADGWSWPRAPRAHLVPGRPSATRRSQTLTTFGTKWVSGGIASCGCASSINRSNVVPDRETPTTNGAGWRPSAAKPRASKGKPRRSEPHRGGQCSTLSLAGERWKRFNPRVAGAWEEGERWL